MIIPNIVAFLEDKISDFIILYPIKYAPTVPNIKVPMSRTKSSFLLCLYKCKMKL